MRIVFMGTPAFAVPVLDAVLEAGHEVVAVYTQPPRPAGRRGRELTPSPVQKRAQDRSIEVRTPASLRSPEEQADFAALGADVAVVAAYGLILPQPILDAPRLGCLNVHGSLLPRWRGAAPIQRAIMAGDAETGACIMQMEAGLDTGPVRLCGSFPIGDDPADEVTVCVARLGADLMVQVLAEPDAFPPVPQDDAGATYAAKIDKAEAHLDFAASAASLARKVQALTPYPGAYFSLAGERIKVHRAMALDRVVPDGRTPGEVIDLVDAGTGEPTSSKRGQAFAIACADGYLLPTVIQPAGKGRMSAAEFLQGAREVTGRIAS